MLDLLEQNGLLRDDDDELRLTQINTDSGGLFSDTETFNLDLLANRTRHSATGSGDWVYNKNNQLLSRPGQEGSGTVSYECDANGNQVKKTEGGKVTQFGYDSSNRLVLVKDAANNLIARYGYDPQNRRLWKEQYRDRVGNALSQVKRTYFLYNEEELIAEATQAITLTAEGSVTATAAPAISAQYGPKPESEFTTGTLFIKTKNSNGEDTFAYYQHNHLMTPMQAVDKTGRVLWAGSYNPFGEATVITPGATQERPTINSNLRLPGQYLDDETGLHYNYFRSYDPRTGRYTQADPIGLGGGWNRFGYVGGESSHVDRFQGAYQRGKAEHRN